MSTPRIIFKPLRLTDLTDPLLTSVQNGETFVTESSGTTASYYKRFSDGVVVQLSGNASAFSIDWSAVTSKPTTLAGYGITDAASALQIASASVLGGVKIGNGLNIASDGTVSVPAGSIAVASTTTLGGIKVGANLSIASDGTLSANASGSASVNATNTFEFTVNFAGADPTSVAGLPTGWSAVISGDSITVTHTTGIALKCINYWGYSATGGVENYRLPSASNAVTILSAARLSQFSFVINTSVCGADTNGSARIDVTF